MTGIQSSAFEKFAMSEGAANLMGILAAPISKRIKSEDAREIFDVVAKTIDSDSFESGGGNIIYTPPIKMVVVKDPFHKRRKGKAMFKFGALNLMKTRKSVNLPKKKLTQLTAQTNETSPALAKAIETSQNPVPALKAISKNPQAVYAGGNTAANMRQVIRSQDKLYRDQLKKKPEFKNIDMRKAY